MRKKAEASKRDTHTVTNPGGSKTVLLAHTKEADAADELTAKTAIARGNYAFKTLESSPAK
jgi:hypothetical protein